MAFKGNLRDINISQFLNLIHLARKTGTLTIESVGEGGQLAFKEGKLIFASLNGQSGHLAAVLERSGKLNTELAKSIQQQNQNASQKELGLMLIGKGYVTQNDILQAVRADVLNIAYHSLTWIEGTFRFEAGQLPSDDTITVAIDLDMVLIEGARRVKEYERLLDELPNLDLPLKFTERPSAAQNVQLAPEEWRIISYINAQNTIRDIARANHLSDFQMRRLVHNLLQAGLVEVLRPLPPNSISEPQIADHRKPATATTTPAVAGTFGPGDRPAPTSRLAAIAQARGTGTPEPPVPPAKPVESPKRGGTGLLGRLRGS